MAVEFQQQLKEITTLYSDAVTKAVNKATAASARRFLATTKATAPRSSSRNQSHFYTTLALRQEKALGISRFLWYARRPGSGLVHLLENDHLSVNGRMIPGSHFVQQALDAEEPRFLAAIKEAIANA